MQPQPVVIVESPFFADEIEQLAQNRSYAIAACADCFKNGEVPFASHLLYPQILGNDGQRDQGIRAGYEFWLLARKIVFYIDRGWSEGMRRAKQRALDFGYSFEERSLVAEQQKRSEGA